MRNIEKYLDDEIKYKKKQIKSSPKKSNHKHLYEPVIVLDNKKGGTRIYRGTLCSVCGKLVVCGYFIESGIGAKKLSRLLLNLNDIQRCYPDLQVINLSNYTVK